MEKVVARWGKNICFVNDNGSENMDKAESFLHDMGIRACLISRWKWYFAKKYPKKRVGKYEILDKLLPKPHISP